MIQKPDWLEEIKDGLGEQLNTIGKEVIEKQQELDERMTGLTDDIDKKQQALAARIQAMEEGSQKTQGLHVPGLEDKKERDKFSFARAIAAITTGNWDYAPFEKEVFDETAKIRATQAVGTDTLGGYIVPDDYMPDLIELYRANSVVMAMGARMLTGLQGSPVKIPKQTGGATGYWVAENANITASDVQFGQVTMTPKQASALVQMSNLSLMISNPSMERVVREDIAITIGLLVDKAALIGIGSSTEPRGIANVPNINTVTWQNTSPYNVYDNLQDMLTELDKDNAARGAMGFVMPPQLRGTFSKERDDSGGSGLGRPLFMFNPTFEAQRFGFTEQLIGFPYRTTTQLRTTFSSNTQAEMIFANWNEALIGMWGGLDIRASQDAGTAFQANQTWIRIIQQVDFAVRHEESFCYSNDVTI